MNVATIGDFAIIHRVVKILMKVCNQQMWQSVINDLAVVLWVMFDERVKQYLKKEIMGDGVLILPKI